MNFTWSIFSQLIALEENGKMGLSNLPIGILSNNKSDVINVFYVTRRRLIRTKWNKVVYFNIFFFVYITLRYE